MRGALIRLKPAMRMQRSTAASGASAMRFHERNVRHSLLNAAELLLSDVFCERTVSTRTVTALFHRRHGRGP